MVISGDIPGTDYATFHITGNREYSKNQITHGIIDQLPQNEKQLAAIWQTLRMAGDITRDIDSNGRNSQFAAGGEIKLPKYTPAEGLRQTTEDLPRLGEREVGGFKDELMKLFRIDKKSKTDARKLKQRDIHEAFSVFDDESDESKEKKPSLITSVANNFLALFGKR